MINDINKLGNNRQLTGGDNRKKPTEGADTAPGLNTQSTNTEQVKLSDEAKQLSNIKDAILNAPTTSNQAKIDSIKQQLSDGSYTIDSKVIASKILQEQSIGKG